MNPIPYDLDHAWLSLYNTLISTYFEKHRVFLSPNLA